MANQANIDATADLIADLVEKATQELIQDLYRSGINVDNVPAFVNALLDLDLEGTLKAKLTNATSAYANAHRNVLETTQQFAAVGPDTLTSYVALNEQVFDNAITNNIASHIRNEVVKGIQVGLTPDQILQSVTSASISPAQMRTLVTSTLNTYSRTIISSMMDEAPKDTKYWYVGPADGKTRDKCLLQIESGELTRDEIISQFGNKVLSEGGGFNCRHQWERISKRGTEFYQPDQASKITKDKNIDYDKKLFED